MWTLKFPSGAWEEDSGTKLWLPKRVNANLLTVSATPSEKKDKWKSGP